MKSTKLLLFFFVTALLLRCSLESPVLPKWTVPLVIPIAPTRINIQEEITNDSTVVSQNDLLFININRDIDPVTITEEALTVSWRDTNVSISLGNISLDTVKTESSESMFLETLLPDLAHHIGEEVAVPETTVTSVPLKVESRDFKMAIIRECDIRIDIYNNLPFVIGPNKYSTDGLVIDVYDSTGIHITEIAVRQNIPPGGTGSAKKSIVPGDNWIHAPISLHYRIPIARDTTLIVTQQMLDSSEIRLALTFLDLELKEVIGKIQPQIVEGTYAVEMDEDNRIIMGKIASGMMHLGFQNNVPLGAAMSIRLPDLLDPSGRAYQQQVEIDGNGETTISKDVSGYIITNSESPGQQIETILLEVEAETRKSQDFVHLKDTDEFHVTLMMDTIKFSEIKGHLARDTLEIGPFEENNVADYGGFSGSFEFQKAQLVIALDNRIDIENLILDLDITGFHRIENGPRTDSARVEIRDRHIRAGNRDTIVIEDQQVVDFLNIYPVDIRSAGSLTYSGHADVRAGDWISGGYALSTPFEFEIKDPEPIELDPDTLTNSDIDETFRDRAGEDVYTAFLRARIVNHSPIGGEVLVFVSGDPNHVDLYDTTSYFNHDAEFIKSVTMLMANVDPVTGFVNEAVESEFEFSLNSKELSIFRNPPVRIGFLLNLEESDGKIAIRNTDYIELSGEIEFGLLINGGD